MKIRIQRKKTLNQGLLQQAGIEQTDSGDTVRNEGAPNRQGEKMEMSPQTHKNKIKTYRGFDLPRSQTVQEEIKQEETVFKGFWPLDILNR